jgi:hypothetical protein
MGEAIFHFRCSSYLCWSTPTAECCSSLNASLLDTVAWVGLLRWARFSESIHGEMGRPGVGFHLSAEWLDVRLFGYGVLGA